MLTSVATKVFESNNNFKYNSEKGLKFSRHYTVEDQSPFDLFKYELRSSIIRESSGKIIFEMTEVEVPEQWSQVLLIDLDRAALGIEQGPALGRMVQGMCQQELLDGTNDDDLPLV